MASPIYFFPLAPLAQLVQRNRLNRAILEARGLADVFGQDTGDVVDVERQTARFDLAGRGPGGQSGAMLSLNPVSGAVNQRLGYYPDFQTWHAFGPTEQEASVWIGIDNEYPPTPADLLRPRTLRGHLVELADGASYEIPVARSPRRQLLPCDLEWDDAGQVVSRVQARYQTLWEEAGEAWSLFYDADTGGLLAGGMARALDLAVRAVGINYRYGRHLQRVLHLIDSKNWEDVLAALADVPFVRSCLEAEKKSAIQPAADTPSTPPGSTTGSPSTGPAGASSGSPAAASASSAA